MSSSDVSQPEKMNLESMSISDHQKAKLKELFPEVFTEGLKVDFDQLKRTLGEMVDGGKERFGMQWAGKADCFKTIQQPSLATLVPCPEEGIEFDTTENVFIEGDNLEVLKLLQKSYLGKVKMIYIDPPYNTGNDFVYPDNYSENLDTYLEYTGQVDGSGRKFGTNVDTDGRFHSKWMNMMYPRLFLAKNLLREDGVIFISIGDDEIKNLQTLCDEIFGEENFAVKFIWKSRQIVDSRSDNGVSNDHEYTLVYFKSGSKLKGKSVSLSKYSNPDNDPRGAWMSNSILGLATKSQRPNLHYDLIDTLTGLRYPCPEATGWRYSKETMAEKIKDARIIFPKNPSGRPREKKYLAELKSNFTNISSILDPNLVGYTLNGTRELRELLGENLFPFPKPVSLIKSYLIQGSNDDDIILDFFAGSATTAHAVMDLNREDGGNRRYICVQLPEPTDDKSEAYKAGYSTIAEISKERIRRVSSKIKAEADEQTDLLAEDKAPLDLGFRVFKLQKSNFSVWDSTHTTDPTQIALQLEQHIDHIAPEASQQAILFELLLKSGYELTTSIETLTLADKTVYSIADNALLICLEKELTIEVMNAIAALEPSRVIVLDEGFQNNDQLKTNSTLTLKAKGVHEFRTV